MTNHSVPCLPSAETGAEDGGSSGVVFWVGLSLAVSSSIFIGSSFIIKKKGLLRVSRESSSRAGSGGYGYLKEWLWWAGLLTMGVGEAANFAAFGFIPAMVVTTLGALSVIVSAILAAYILDEQLNIHGKMGVLLACLGSTVVVLNAPKEGSVNTLNEIGRNLVHPAFLAFSTVVLGLVLYLICYMSPRHGTRNILVYIGICSLLGAFTVTSAKGLSISLRLTFTGDNQMLHPLTWFFLVSLIINIAVQMNYLNKALDIYNTAIVTPIYYVMFNILASTASAILFKEFDISFSNIIVILCGFLTIVTAVFLLQAFREINITLTDVMNSAELYRRKPDQPSTSYSDASIASQLDSNHMEEGVDGLTFGRSHLSRTSSDPSMPPVACGPLSSDLQHILKHAY